MPKVIDKKSCVRYSRGICHCYLQPKYKATEEYTPCLCRIGRKCEWYEFSVMAFVHNHTIMLPIVGSVIGSLLGFWLATTAIRMFFI